MFPYTDEHFREFTSPNFFLDLIMLKKSGCPCPQFFLRWKIIGIITEHLICCFSICLVLAVNLSPKILDVLVLYQLGKIIHRNVLMVCMQNSFQELLSQVCMLQTNRKIVNISAIEQFCVLKLYLYGTLLIGNHIFGCDTGRFLGSIAKNFSFLGYDTVLTGK